MVVYGEVERKKKAPFVCGEKKILTWLVMVCEILSHGWKGFEVLVAGFLFELPHCYCWLDKEQLVQLMSPSKFVVVFNRHKLRSSKKNENAFWARQQKCVCIVCMYVYKSL